ncbi:unnamed protein product [Arctia plantaginis]|uniref:Uncharacterized protein n=1 Tax=Arctia plantaginis TaxID=874455 RepID=A0A8S1BSY8_ARCPL|nr:unnamed protein product [Arctia plantaginis]
MFCCNSEYHICAKQLYVPNGEWGSAVGALLRCPIGAEEVGWQAVSAQHDQERARAAPLRALVRLVRQQHIAPRRTEGETLSERRTATVHMFTSVTISVNR